MMDIFSNYNTHIDKGAMFNTPPVFPIFASLQTLKWLKANGGLEAMYEKNKKVNILSDDIYEHVKYDIKRFSIL